jgi:hypothetical protein
MHTSSSTHIARSIRVLVWVFLSIIVLSYAGLIALGRWQLDEYSEFYRLRTHPLYLIERLTWSPRPISEPLYSAYGWSVNHFHQPLIIPFLGLLWGILLAAALLTAWQKMSKAEDGAWASALLGLTLVTLSLAGGDTTEVFYWPAGSVAYLPTLAATLLLFLQAIDGRLSTPRGRIVGSVCLVIAAGSSEAGATFVLFYLFVQVVQYVRERLSKRAEPVPLLWLLAPFLFASAVVITVRLNRFRQNELAAISPNAGHLIRSTLAAFEEMVFEAIGRPMLASAFHLYPNPHSWLHAGPGFVLQMIAGSHLWMEFLLFLAVALLWAGGRRPERQTVRAILELLVPLLLAGLLTTAAANFHFGRTCCERHELLREAWWNTTLAGLGIVSTAFMPNAARERLARFCAYAPVALLLSVMALGFLPPLVRSYRSFRSMRQATEGNYTSGFSTTTNRMVYVVPPSLGLIREEELPLGNFTRKPQATEFSIEDYPYFLMDFFEKQNILIENLPRGEVAKPGAAE